MNALPSNADRFLDAFNRIELILKKRAKDADKNLGFSALVRSSKELVQRQRDLLLDYANLRNAIVHTRGGQIGQPIADPRLSTVQSIEKQADVLERPPIVLEVLKLQPPIVHPIDSSIFEFFNDVKLPHNYSQAPVRDNKGALHLVTTNAVARWVAASYEPKQGAILSDASIGEVLAYSELGDRVEIRPRGFKVSQAWRVFSGETGSPPAAVVFTHSGSATEKPLGMCVRADLPDMLRALGV